VKKKKKRRQASSLAPLKSILSCSYAVINIGTSLANKKRKEERERARCSPLAAICQVLKVKEAIEKNLHQASLSKAYLREKLVPETSSTYLFRKVTSPDHT
jgi:hypothetical protein